MLDCLAVQYACKSCEVVKINRFKEELVTTDKSQKWLAKELNKNTTAVTAFCNNKSQPHLKDLKKIAEILDVDIRELMAPTKD